MAAATAIGAKAPNLRQAVLDFIRSRREYRATDHEVAQALDLLTDTSRARRVELRDLGMIVDSGRTRPTPSGRAATVWIISQHVSIYE